MGNVFAFEYETAESFTYAEDGNYHIYLPTFYKFGSNGNDRVDFILDTGAYITVITRREAKLLGFANPHMIKAGVPLSGFAGGCLADILEIPGFIIGGQRLEGVKVAIPHIDTDSNILGLNVLELFKLLVDTENDVIYFAKNPCPEIPEPLRCSKIYAITTPRRNWKNTRTPE